MHRDNPPAVIDDGDDDHPAIAPGLALGRPFLPAEYDPSLPNTKVVPTVASAMELMSDWVVEL